MAYEDFLFEQEEEEKTRGKWQFSLHLPWGKRKKEEERKGSSVDEDVGFSSFYAGGMASLIEEEEAEKAVSKSLRERLRENPFTWYDYIIFLIEILLFILLVLALLGRIPFF